VRWLTLNRPGALNAFNDAVYAALVRELAAAAADDSVAAVVLTGAGRYFTAGADLVDAVHPTEGFIPFGAALRAFPKLLVAALNGPAVGVGVTLLPHCDLVLAAAGATLSCPFLSTGLVPELCSTVTLPAALGPATARHMIYTEAPLRVDDPRAAGLIAAVVSSADALRPAVHDMLRTALARPLASAALPLFKRLLTDPTAAALTAAWERENAALLARIDAGDTLVAATARLGALVPCRCLLTPCIATPQFHATPIHAPAAQKPRQLAACARDCKQGMDWHASTHAATEDRYLGCGTG